MNCPNCGAAMKRVPNRDYFYCEYCSSYYFPTASSDGIKILGESTNLTCPLCSKTLVTGSVEGVSAWTCAKCRGVLMLMPEFADLVQNRRAARPGPSPPPRYLEIDEPQQHVHCPRCAQWLDRHPYFAGPAGTIIDTCEHCNLIWLDRDELSAVARN